MEEDGHAAHRADEAGLGSRVQLTHVVEHATTQRGKVGARISMVVLLSKNEAARLVPQRQYSCPYRALDNAPTKRSRAGGSARWPVDPRRELTVTNGARCIAAAGQTYAKL
jgi:hypothetical protein